MGIVALELEIGMIAWGLYPTDRYKLFVTNPTERC